MSTNAVARLTQQYSNNKIGGGPENLNDIELPKDNTHKIRVAIKEATKDYKAHIKEIDKMIKALQTTTGEKDKLGKE